MAKTSELKGRFALFCDYAFLTSDQKLSLIGEFDKLISTSSSSKPVLSRGYVVASFDGPSNQEFKIKAVFSDPKSKKILPDKEFSVKVGDGGRAGILVALVNVVFDQLGEYTVKFIYDKVELCRANLTVISPTRVNE